MSNHPQDPLIEVTAQVEPPFESQVDPARIEHVVRQTLQAEGVAGPLEVSVVISDDDTLQELNRRFRGIDAPTDVLSFAEGSEPTGFILPPDTPRYLGDIVISFPRAVAQAAERGHTPAQEVDLLVVHGCLHLLGYEDETEEGTQIMWDRQEEILKSV